MSARFIARLAPVALSLVAGAALIIFRPAPRTVPATSLVYDINWPAGGTASANMGDTMIAALKKRVDPDDILDIQWRSRGSRQIEVLFPAPTSGAVAATDVSDLKQLLSGTGALEFHILADARRGGLEKQMIAEMRARMTNHGVGPAPLTEVADEMLHWYAVDRVEEFDVPGYAPETMEWKDKKHYILCLILPDASMTHDGSTPPWGLQSAYPVQGENGDHQVGFKFDSAGAALFSTLTRKWYQKSHDTYHDQVPSRLAFQVPSRLAILLDDTVISAPKLNGAIEGGSGVIEAGGNGYTNKDLNYLIRTLNAGGLPASLSSEPVSQTMTTMQLPFPAELALNICGIFLIAAGLVLAYYLLVRSGGRAGEVLAPPPLPAAHGPVLGR